MCKKTSRCVENYNDRIKWPTNGKWIKNILSGIVKGKWSSPFSIMYNTDFIVLTQVKIEEMVCDGQ